MKRKRSDVCESEKKKDRQGDIRGRKEIKEQELLQERKGEG